MSGYFSRAVSGAGFAIALFAAASSRAEPADHWPEAYPRFRSAEYVSTGVLGATLAAGLFLLEQNPDGPQGGILFDDSAHDALTLSTRSARDRAVEFGDYAYFFMLGYPLLDAPITAWGVRGSADVAGQMLLIDAQSYALSGVISVFSQKLVGRDRPFLANCSEDPDYDPDCNDAVARQQSLLSGHTLMAFTGAGLTCAHHLNLELYGGAADPLACAAGMALASWVGASRLLSARHYTSDVLAGVVAGLGSGFVLPSVLHYGLWSGSEPSSVALFPYGDAGQLGLMFMAVE